VVTTLTILSPNHYKGRSGNPTLIGIHTMEAPEVQGTAIAVANWFRDPSVNASAHWCVDDDTRVRCVADEDAAWSMPPTNDYSLNVEMAGYAAQNGAQWDDSYSLAVMDNAALCVAEWSRKYGIPVRHLTDAEIRDGGHGIVGHADINRVYHDSDHVDPGSSFPWDQFLGMVNKHLGPPQPKPPAIPNCTALQKAVHCNPDNMWGAITDAHCTAVISATYFGGNKFPNGTKFAQACVGAVQDGIWGPNSQAALIATVKTTQLALGRMGFSPGPADGIWGVNTNKAYEAARTACHI
jgi:N-acetylmuramoyl-L-alanine amidase